MPSFGKTNPLKKSDFADFIIENLRFIGNIENKAMDIIDSVDKTEEEKKADEKISEMEKAFDKLQARVNCWCVWADRAERWCMCPWSLLVNGLYKGFLWGK